MTKILARGPQITMGYLGDAKATKENYDAEGYLHTGDIGFIDERGCVTIIDRIKELIKVQIILFHTVPNITALTYTLPIGERYRGSSS